MLLDLHQVQAVLDGRETARRDGTDSAAVAVILRSGGKSTEVLVIQRACQMRDPWSGHLAFPGGRSDPQDHDALSTAVRETREELGVDLALVGRVLGPLDHVSSFGPGLPPLVIAPFAFALEADSALKLDRREVERVFWVPLGPLLRGERDTSIQVQREGRSFRFPGYHVEDQVLWGLTYRMLKSFLSLFEER